MDRLHELTARASGGTRLNDDDVRELARLAPADPAVVLGAARVLRDATVGPRITFSKKVFIPLTKLCRDACGYCTFAHPPVPGERAYLTIDEVLDVARAGEEAACAEGLFTLGDKRQRKGNGGGDRTHGMGLQKETGYFVAAW